MNECELGGHGTVTPYGVVSVGDVEFWDDGPDRDRAGWWNWFANVAIVGIDPGVNGLDFVATYEDGSTLTETITVTCDPEAVLEPGFVVSMDQYDQAEGYLMTFIRGDVDDQPDGWGIDPTDDVVVIPVHPDATFIVQDPEWRHTAHLSAEEFAALVTFIDEGHCGGCPEGDCPTGPYGFQFPGSGGCIWNSWDGGGIASIAFELLVDAEGTIRQGTQLVYN